MKLKSVFQVLFAAFIVVSIVQSPTESAAIVKSLLVWGAGAIQQIFAFFGALLHGAAVG